MSDCGWQKSSKEKHFERSHSGFTSDVPHVLSSHTLCTKKKKKNGHPFCRQSDRITGSCLSVAKSGVVFLKAATCGFTCSPWKNGHVEFQYYIH